MSNTETTNPDRIALLLIAHGSRRKEANQDLEFIAAQPSLERKFDVIQTAYLELSEPNILDGGVLCVGKGATRVIMLPYFLSAGIHVREDLTQARDELKQRFPTVEFLLAEPFGRHPLLLQIVEDRAAEAQNRRAIS